MGMSHGLECIMLKGFRSDQRSNLSKSFPRVDPGGPIPDGRVALLRWTLHAKRKE